jgi:hypothetical protein
MALSANTTSTPLVLTAVIPQSVVNETIVLTIPAVELHRIKLAAMFSSIDDSFLTLEQRFIQDMSANDVDRTVVQMRAFAADVTRPRVQRVSMDLNTSTLELLFDEPVLSSSVNVQELTLAAGQLSGSTVQLVDAISSTNGLVVTIKLGRVDLESVQYHEDLMVDLATSFVFFTSQFAADVAGNQVVEVERPVALHASEFTQDHQRPILTNFTLNMHTGVLRLSFSEVMDFSSVNVSGISFASHNSEFAPEYASYRLASSQVMTTDDGRVIAIQLSQADLDEMTAVGIAISQATAWLSVVDGAAIDQAALALRSVVFAAPSAFTTNTRRPTLVHVELDMHTEILTLSFSETVVAASVSVDQITVQESASAPARVLALTNSSVRTSGNGPIQTIQLSKSDGNALKLDVGLAVSQDSTFVAMANGAAADPFGNLLTARTSSNAAPCVAFAADDVAPVLERAVLNLNTGYLDTALDVVVASASLELEFSEPVDSESFDATKFTVFGRGTPFALTGFHAALSSRNGTTHLLKLLNADVNAMKIFIRDFVNASTVAVSLAADAVMDLSGNTNVASSPLQVDNLIPDSTPPILVSFDIDMDSATLTLYFDEIVRGESFEPPELSLMDAAVRDDVFFTLTGGIAPSGAVWSAGSSFAHSDSTQLLVKLVKADLDEVKRLSLCTNQNDCYLVHSEWLVEDMSENYIVGCV